MKSKRSPDLKPTTGRRRVRVYGDEPRPGPQADSPDQQLQGCEISRATVPFTSRFGEETPPRSTTHGAAARADRTPTAAVPGERHESTTERRRHRRRRGRSPPHLRARMDHRPAASPTCLTQDWAPDDPQRNRTTIPDGVRRAVQVKWCASRRQGVTRRWSRSQGRAEALGLAGEGGGCDQPDDDPSCDAALPGRSDDRGREETFEAGVRVSASGRLRAAFARRSRKSGRDPG